MLCNKHYDELLERFANAHRADRCQIMNSEDLAEHARHIHAACEAVRPTILAKCRTIVPGAPDCDAA